MFGSSLIVEESRPTPNPDVVTGIKEGPLVVQGTIEADEFQPTIETYVSSATACIPRKEAREGG